MFITRKLRLPICEIGCEIFQLFARLFMLFAIHRFTTLFGPKVKKNKQASEKVEKFRIKFRGSVNVALL